MIKKYNQPCVERITNLLEEQGKTQKDLCKELHISENTYKRWKDGESRSYGTHIVKISEYLGVTPDYILCGELKDKELLEEFHKLDNDNKELIVKAIKQLMLKGYISSE